MTDPMRLEGKRSTVNQALLYAVPAVVLVAAASWLMLSQGGDTAAAPEPAVNPEPAALTTPIPTDSVTASNAASMPAPVVVRPRAAPPVSAVARAATPTAASAETAARDTSAIEPLPVDQLAATVASAPAELAPAPVIAPSPSATPSAPEPVMVQPSASDTPVIQ